MKVRIATRRSDLALWQANHVAEHLRAAGAETELVKLVTRGDRIDDVPLSQVEGKAFFTKEIEEALLDGRADVAVHSHKDLPVEDPPGLAVVAVPERATIAERLLVAPAAHVPDAPLLPLAHGARVGTSAPRRAEQLLALRPDLEVLDLRGNVPTRVERLREGRYDAIVLAAAGLDRLELDTSDLVAFELPTSCFVPAPAQGALALQTRADDRAVIELVQRALHDETTQRRVQAERSLLLEMGGGCSLPLGASVERIEDRGEEPWRMRAFLGADQPRAGCAPRWVEAFGATPEEALAEAARRLFAGEPTGMGPLAGRRVALTGSASAESDSPLARALAALGLDLVHETVIGFEDVAAPRLAEHVGHLRPGDGLAVTSRETARRLAGLDLPEGVSVAAVGAGTARALADHGLRVDHLGNRGARELARTWELAAGARVLFPCAQEARLELEEELVAREIAVERVPLYRTVARPGVELDPRAEIRLYMSPSAVEAVLEQEASSGAAIRIALGPTTSERLERAGLAHERPPSTAAVGAATVVPLVARLLARTAPAEA